MSKKMLYYAISPIDAAAPSPVINLIKLFRRLLSGFTLSNIKK
jgi:hypothetical protein